MKPLDFPARPHQKAWPFPIQAARNEEAGDPGRSRRLRVDRTEPQVERGTLHPEKARRCRGRTNLWLLPTGRGKFENGWKRKARDATKAIVRSGKMILMIHCARQNCGCGWQHKMAIGGVSFWGAGVGTGPSIPAGRAR